MVQTDVAVLDLPEAHSVTLRHACAEPCHRNWRHAAALDFPQKGGAAAW